MRQSDEYMRQYIGSDNGLSPGQRQAIIWTNAGILLIGPLGTNVSEIFIKIYAGSLFENVNWKMAAISSRPHCDKAVILRQMEIPTVCTLLIRAHNT